MRVSGNEEGGRVDLKAIRVVVSIFTSRAKRPGRYYSRSCCDTPLSRYCRFPHVARGVSDAHRQPFVAGAAAVRQTAAAANAHNQGGSNLHRIAARSRLSKRRSRLSWNRLSYRAATFPKHLLIPSGDSACRNAISTRRSMFLNFQQSASPCRSRLNRRSVDADEFLMVRRARLLCVFVKNRGSIVCYRRAVIVNFNMNIVRFAAACQINNAIQY